MRACGSPQGRAAGSGWASVPTGHRSASRAALAEGSDPIPEAEVQEGPKGTRWAPGNATTRRSCLVAALQGAEPPPDGRPRALLEKGGRVALGSVRLMAWPWRKWHPAAGGHVRTQPCGRLRSCARLPESKPR